jgi:PAS domain S-box-containing protein
MSKNWGNYLRRYEMLPWLTGLALFVAMGVGAWAIASPVEAGFNGLVLVGGLAILGFIAFYMLATSMPTKSAANSEASSRAYWGGLTDQQVFMGVLDTAPDAYLVLRRDGTVLYANHAYEELTKAGNRGRNLGRPLPLEQVFAGDDDLAAPLYRLARAAKGGEEVEEILRLKTIEGDVRYMRASVSAMENSPEHVVWRIAHDPLLGPGVELGDPDRPSVALQGVGFVGDEGTSLAGDGGAAGPWSETEPAKEAAGTEPDETSVPQEWFAQLFANAPVGIALVDETGAIRQWNAALEAMIKIDVKEGVVLADMVAEEDSAAVAERLTEAAKGEANPAPLDAHIQDQDGANIQLYASLVGGGEGAQAVATIVYLIDMTEQKTLELQYTQSQKLQAVGQLAGGVAHDFNNLLTAIIGFCDLLLARHEVGDPSFSDIDQIRQNANRAANLVGQLLAFSRKQTLTPKVLSPTDVLTEISMLLRRLLGETIELKLNHGRDLGLIKVDQSQLDTALINLAVNARDAMARGGKLIIESSNFVQPEDRDSANEIMAPGDYVLIEVKDTGKGIEQDDIKKIFEPFFTTKEVGQGTGLGLSTVYGIIKQMGGYVFPESEKGVGTTFRIYLPFYEETEGDARVRTQQSAPVTPKDLTGVGTIMLVEDEEAVRAFAKRARESRGYNVLEAGNGEIALDVMNGHDGTIDLMVSDVVMPGMDGSTLAEKVRKLRPETKIIFISGYAQDVFKESMARPEDISFLPKPFSLKQLAARVKEVLSE